MEYAELVDVYDRLGATASTNEKRDVLAATFADADDHLWRLVTLVRGRLGPAYDRPELGVSSSLTLDAILRGTGATEDAVRERWKETGDLGDAAAWAAEHGGQQTLFSDPLTVERVHDTLLELATYEGPGSQGRRIDELAGLIADATPNEARYVTRLALGHMRVGVGEGLIRDAIAHAFLDGSQSAIDAVERAYQVTTDFRVVAETARDDGIDALAALDVELFRPVQSMLAETTDSLTGGLASAATTEDDDRVRCEYKYDGIRIQVHVAGDEVRLFTRRLEEITDQFPDVVRAVQQGVTSDEVVLDGELVGYTKATIDTAHRTPVAFQRLSQRVKREEDVPSMARDVPVVVHLFDCIYDGETRLDEPLRDRLTHLDATFATVEPEPAEGVAGLELASATWSKAESPAAAEALYREALEEGHEGLMVKNPNAPYEPGRRVGRVLKLKPTMEPLDLVVTRAKYSEGRRSELLGRLYLACYDEDAAGDTTAEALREVGRMSTGYTDEELESLTDRLEEKITQREGRAVELDPDVVLEVEYEEIQASPTYDSGYALRFPRFLGVRDVLGPEDADTLARVESLYESQ